MGTTPANSLNISAAGLVKFDGTATFSGVTTTQYDVLVGGASNGISNVGPGSSGQVLQSAGNAANPAYSTATYPAVATGTGTILRADGTNWVATTSTYPNTNAINTIMYASSANVLGSISAVNNGVLITSASGVPSFLADGTTGQILTATTGAPPAWVAASSVGQVTFVQVNITSANWKTIFTTPVVLLAAPAAGTINVVLGGMLKLNYGGSNAFTTGGTVDVYYTTPGTGSSFFLGVAAAYTGTTNKTYTPFVINQGDPGASEASSISVTTSSGNPGGNAAGNNTVTIGLWYQNVTMT